MLIFRGVRFLGLPEWPWKNCGSKGMPETPQRMRDIWTESIAPAWWEFGSPQCWTWFTQQNSGGGGGSRFPAKRRFQSGKHRRNHHGTYEAKNHSQMLHGPGITYISLCSCGHFSPKSYRPVNIHTFGASVNVKLWALRITKTPQKPGVILRTPKYTSANSRVQLTFPVEGSIADS